MALLQALQDASAELKQPSDFTSVIGNTNAHVKLLLALANAEVEEAERRFNWPNLVRVGSFTIVAGQSAYALPDDFHSMTPDSMWNTGLHWRVYGPLTGTEWSTLQWSVGSVPVCPYFRIEGWGDDQIQLWPTPGADSAGQTYYYRYQSYTCIKPAKWATGISYAAGSYSSYNGNIYYTTSGGSSGATPPTHTSGSVSDGGVTWTFNTTPYNRFLADTDTSLFGDACLKLGVKQRWLSINRFDNTVELVQWDTALKDKYATIKGPRTLSLNSTAGMHLIDEYNVPQTGVGL